jgi:hypothetical protein
MEIFPTTAVLERQVNGMFELNVVEMGRVTYIGAYDDSTTDLKVIKDDLEMYGFLMYSSDWVKTPMGYQVAILPLPDGHYPAKMNEIKDID